MKQLSGAEKSRATEKFKASLEARRRTRMELVNAAHEAKNDVWPQYLWPDGTKHAWWHRKSVDLDFIEKRGNFSREIASLALTDPDWETKESVAAWLRSELKLLRDAETNPGSAPVRRGKTLSRTEISEIAMELLQCLGGECLICLFQELLDIDRHRKSLADHYSQLNQAAEIEAQAQLQGHSLGVRLLAKQMSVSPSTVTRWKKSRSFCELVDFHKDSWGLTRRDDYFEQIMDFHRDFWVLARRDDYFEQIKRDFPQATDAECLRRAFQMYVEKGRSGRLRDGPSAKHEEARKES